MSEEIKIEKNIPIPSSGKKALVIAEAFEKMEIGDSFFSDLTTTNNVRTSFHRDTSKRFISRKEGSGRRYWRVK